MKDKILNKIFEWVAQLEYALDKPANFKNFWCRLRGHPNGIVFYNYGFEAQEPDYHCKDCDELLN